MLLGSRRERDYAISAALRTSLLGDLTNIVRSYDIRPGQRWSRQSEAGDPFCNSHTLSEDELKFTGSGGSVQISEDGHFLTTHAVNHLQWFCSHRFQDGANKLSILIPNESLDIIGVEIGIKSEHSRALIHFNRLGGRLRVWDSSNWIFLNETVFGKVMKIEISILLQTHQIKMVANGCVIHQFLMDLAPGNDCNWRLGMSELIQDLEECKPYIVVSDSHLLNSFTLQIESEDE
jgi:hypothetical protein